MLEHILKMREPARELLLTCFYTNSGPGYAHVRFAGESDANLTVTVLLARLEEAEVVRFAGNEASAKLEVFDTDRIVIMADYLGELVAHGVFEVATSLVPHGYLLMPRGGANLLLDQEEQLRESELDDGDGFDKIQTREEQ